MADAEAHWSEEEGEVEASIKRLENAENQLDRARAIRKTRFRLALAEIKDHIQDCEWLIEVYRRYNRQSRREAQYPVCFNIAPGTLKLKQLVETLRLNGLGSDLEDSDTFNNTDMPTQIIS